MYATTHNACVSAEVVSSFQWHGNRGYLHDEHRTAIGHTTRSRLLANAMKMHEGFETIA